MLVNYFIINPGTVKIAVRTYRARVLHTIRQRERGRGSTRLLPIYGEIDGAEAFEGAAAGAGGNLGLAVFILVFRVSPDNANNSMFSLDCTDDHGCHEGSSVRTI
jgi:hypothetical protein